MYSIDQSLSSLKAAARKQLLSGAGKGATASAGIIGHLQQLFDTAMAREDTAALDWLENFRQALPCQDCGGSRLRREAMSVTVAEHNIYQLCCKSVSEVRIWLDAYQPDASRAPIVEPIIKPIRHRLEFLDKVGLGYLTLERGADTLSGGELQRVRLAASIGSGLVGVCYVLDEPSIDRRLRQCQR